MFVDEKSVVSYQLTSWTLPWAGEPKATFELRTGVFYR